MSVCTRVLALLVLEVGLACCFTWDIVVSENKTLTFYNCGTITHTEDIPLDKEIHAITYDPIHYRVLFANSQQISSFDLSTRNIQPLVTKKSGSYFNLAYDPVQQLLFWTKGLGIYSFSLNPATSNKSVDGNLIVRSNYFCYDIAVDSCGGFIYWITDIEIERAQFDGSEREVLINSIARGRYNLAIDQQTQKMYWTEAVHGLLSIESADLNGKNRRTLYTIKNETKSGSLTISNDFIYWHSSNQKAIWQLPKNQSQEMEAKIILNTKRFNVYFDAIATNYTIKEQIQGNENCETLKSLLLNESEPNCTNVNLLCVHGTIVSGESRCECTQGYTGEICDISVCQNYCLQGDCSVSAEGQPKCRCNVGYSGERCEENACHEYCLNSGVCSLNEDHDPVCQCTAGYDGERCAVPTVATMLNTDIPPATLSSAGVKSTSA